MQKSKLLQYIREELSVDEALEVYRWITQDETHERYFARLKNLWEVTAMHGKGEGDFDLERQKYQIKQKIRANRKAKACLPGFLPKLQKIAAILFIPFLLGTLYFITQYFQDPSATDYHTFIVPKGQKSHLVLEDGTRVWLNSESKLKFADLKGSRKRVVRLEGEAYFQVSRSKTKPFIVRTSDLNIRVHGTEFNVKAYPEEKTIETTLVEGKVSIEKKGASKSQKKEAVYLNPREKLTYYKKEQKGVTEEVIEQEHVKERKKTAKQQQVIQEVKEKAVINEEVETDLYTSWKDNRLVFRNESFGELARKMERWYNVEIHFGDEELKKYTYWGSFDDETVGQALDALRRTTPFEYRLKKREIHITRKINKLTKTPLPME